MAREATGGVSSVERVRASIREKLLSGEVAPGARLPSIRAAAKDLRVHPLTIAEAYRRLQAEGLVESKAGSGTFAADRSSLGEVLCLMGSSEQPASHAAVVNHFLSELGPIAGVPVTCRMVERDRDVGLTLLARELDKGVLRGVMMGTMSVSWVLAAQQLLSKHGIPLIHHSPRRVARYSIGMDMPQATRTGARHLIEQGCRSVIFAAHSLDVYPELAEAFTATCEALRVRHAARYLPFEENLPSAEIERFGRRAAESLVAEGMPCDGVLISDDVLGRGFLTGLLAHGVRVPEQVRICTHCRAGDSYPDIFHLPVARVECDDLLLAREAHDLMARLVDGEDVPPEHFRLAPKLIPASAFRAASGSVEREAAVSMVS